jgi:hypothetical protein
MKAKLQIFPLLTAIIIPLFIGIYAGGKLISPNQSNTVETINISTGE